MPSFTLEIKIIEKKVNYKEQEKKRNCHKFKGILNLCRIPEECLLCSKDLRGRRRAFGQICQTTSMRNQMSPNHFTNQGGQVGCNVIHFS
uniref:Nucleolar protein 56 n=1 Tax=Rhizophora mucronata TaxID=61149 RepID=A0A2P2MGA4_RHIMU